MENHPHPTLLETTLGGMLQDIGKFMQRAHGSVRSMNPTVKNRESVVLPTDGRGGYTHKHVLWTEAFFQWMEDEGLSFPPEINLGQVRNMAVFHHKPDSFGALGWLAAEADRLSSGMDRKQRDELAEYDSEQPRGWNGFIKTPMLSPFAPVNLGLGEAPQRKQQLAELIPDNRLLPLETVDTSTYPQTYAALWHAFAAEFSALCRSTNNVALFCEGLLSLSERYTWAIPSSTVDLPDISLHDHNRTVAAIAACLHAWHGHHETLTDETAIRNRNQPKFRLLAGDLSGIQHTLFLLANQQVKGVNKVLRARSFLMGMLLEAAALRCRETLGLPVFNLIQNAGGRFVLLVPDLPGLPETVAELRTELDTWLQERYLGELALNLVLSERFAGNGLIPPNFQAVQDSLARRFEEAKLQPFRDQPTGVVRVDYANDECQICGVRPARETNEETRRCQVCHDEHRVGGWLPKIHAASWHYGAPRPGEQAIGFFGGLKLSLHEQLPGTPSDLISGFRIYRGDETIPSSLPLRFIANHVPLLQEWERYQNLSDEAEQVLPGEIKTFEHLAQNALESDGEDGTLGKPFLAILKADVDRLGMLFGFGLSDPDTNHDRATISRFAALSRMTDLFFTGYMQQRLRQSFPATYTVYAGGDDLLLMGPWRQMVTLTEDLNNQFRRYTGDNPNITLSAGFELMKPNHPLNRSVRSAELRLERAKDAGRNRVCLIDDQPLTWDELPARLAEADTVSGWLRHKLVSTALIYKLLYFADQRLRTERQLDIECANWRARWGYHLARNVRDGSLPDREKHQIMSTLNRLMGLNERIEKQDQWICPRIAVSIALYRNRC